MSKKIAYYDDPSFNYQRYWQSRQYENEAEKICLKKIFQLIPQKESLVDIGSGFGRLTAFYAPLFKRCTLVDPSEKILQEAKDFCGPLKNISFKKGFVEKLPVADGSFEVALTVRTFHHLKNPQTAIEEIHRILKPKGYLVLEFANKSHLKNIFKALAHLDFSFFSSHQPSITPFFNYHPNQIKTLLLTNGFKIIKTFSVSNFRSPLLKKIIPSKILLLLENFIQPLGTFGPSIFILSQKWR